MYLDDANIKRFINDDTDGDGFFFYSQKAHHPEGLQCGPHQPAVRPPHDSQGLIGDCEQAYM